MHLKLQVKFCDGSNGLERFKGFMYKERGIPI